MKKQIFVWATLSLAFFATPTLAADAATNDDSIVVSGSPDASGTGQVKADDAEDFE